jgi:hypothetical protein
MSPQPASAIAGVARTSVLRALIGYLGDAWWLLFCIFLLPVTILAIGAPLALFVRFVIEIARR